MAKSLMWAVNGDQTSPKPAGVSSVYIVNGDTSIPRPAGVSEVYAVNGDTSIPKPAGVSSVFIDGVEGNVPSGVSVVSIPNYSGSEHGVPAKTMRFKFYDETIDPTQWENVWNISATWTKVDQGIYDWHCDYDEWAGKHSGSGASSVDSVLATYRYIQGGNWRNYLRNVDFDIIDSDLTGVTNVYQLFNVANGVHHCSLKNTGSVQNWGECFNNSNRFVRLESLDPLDMSSVDVSNLSTHPMFNGANQINSPIVLNIPNATSLKGLFAGSNNKSSSTLTINLSSAFTAASSTVLGNASFEEVIINGTTSITNAHYFNSSNVKKYTWTDWNTAGVNCTEMFRNCVSLTEVSLPYNAKVTNATSMFKSCSLLSTSPALDLSSCTLTDSMIDGCSSLTYVPSNYDLTALTSASRMFANCSALTHIPSYILTSATNLGNFALNCTALVQVPVLTCPATTNANGMFSGCTAVESGALSMYNYLSTKPVEVTLHNNTFTNCGSDTTTGAAELAQIPSSWGGTGA